MADEDEGPFDPSKKNVDQVVEYLEREDIDDVERARVLEAEADGKARKGVREWAEAYAKQRQDESLVDMSTLDVDQLKAYANENGIDLGGASDRDGILAAISAASPSTDAKDGGDEK